LRKETKFEWTDECEAALKHLKETLSAPLVLSQPDQEEVLYLKNNKHYIKGTNHEGRTMSVAQRPVTSQRLLKNYKAI